MNESKPIVRAKRPLTLEDEWDDPAMIALLRQQQEDRVEFAKSFDRATWLKSMEESPMRHAEIAFVAKPRHVLKAKVVQLPW